MCIYTNICIILYITQNVNRKGWRIFRVPKSHTKKEAIGQKVCVTNPSKLDRCLNDVARSKNAYALQSSKNTNSKEDIPRFNVEIWMCLEVFINTFCQPLIFFQKRLNRHTHWKFNVYSDFYQHFLSYSPRFHSLYQRYALHMAQFSNEQPIQHLLYKGMVEHQFSP